jgi:hypothetical protein
VTRRTALVLAVAAALLGSLAYAQFRSGPEDGAAGGGPGEGDAHDVSGSHPLPNEIR